MAIGLNVKYFISDSEGVRMLGSTNMRSKVLEFYSFARRSAKLSINFMPRSLFFNLIL